MGRVIALVTAALCAVCTAPAFADVGGIVAGSVSADWTLSGADAPSAWTGQVAIDLDPGKAAQQAAAERIRKGDHYWQPNMFVLGGAHIASLSSSRVVAFPCDEGTSTRTATATALTDPQLPISVDGLQLDLLRGRGTTRVELAEDNYSKPLPMSGLYFLPLPGHVAIHRDFSGCGESFPPDSSDDELPAFSFGEESAVPPAVTRVLETTDIPLERSGGTWSTGGHIKDRESNVAVDVDYAYRLVGPVASWEASCVVPRDGDLARARSAAAAVAVLKRAGFPRAHFAGAQSTRYHRHGHFFVDEKFTSSGLSTCYRGSPKVFLAR